THPAKEKAGCAALHAPTPVKVLVYCYFTVCNYPVATAALSLARFEPGETRMLLSQPLQAFVDRSPLSVMVNATLERVFDPEALEEVFQHHAQRQYTKVLTFAHCVRVLSDVVYRQVPSVGAWYQAFGAELPVTRQALYDKLKHTDLPVAAG